MDAIESVEAAVRTQLAYHFAMTNAPFGYLDAANLPDLEVKVPDVVLRSWLGALNGVQANDSGASQVP